MLELHHCKISRLLQEQIMNTASNPFSDMEDDLDDNWASDTDDDGTEDVALLPPCEQPLSVPLAALADKSVEEAPAEKAVAETAPTAPAGTHDGDQGFEVLQ